MKVREIKENELSDLLELYTHLHELGVPENSEHLQNTWSVICRDGNHHIIVCEVNELAVNFANDDMMIPITTYYRPSVL